MLTTHNVRFLSSSASLFPLLSANGGKRRQHFFLVHRIWICLWAAELMLSRAGGEIQLSGFLPSSQSVSQCRPGKVLSVYVHADKQTRCFGDKSEWRQWSSSYRHNFFSTSLTVQLMQWGLWCLISIIYSSHSHRNLASGPGSSTSGFLLF